MQIGKCWARSSCSKSLRENQNIVSSKGRIVPVMPQLNFMALVLLLDLLISFQTWSLLANTLWTLHSILTWFLSISVHYLVACILIYARDAPLIPLTACLNDTERMDLQLETAPTLNIHEQHFLWRVFWGNSNSFHPSFMIVLNADLQTNRQLLSAYFQYDSLFADPL